MPGFFLVTTNFFNDKILSIRERIDGLLASTSADPPSGVGTLEAAVGPDTLLSLINHDQQTSTILKSKLLVSWI